MKTARAVLGKLASFLDAIGAVMLVICTVVVFLNVIFRYFFNSPFPWGDEFSVLMLAWFVFLPQPALEHRNQQLQMTVLYNVINERVRKVFNLLRSLTTIFLSLFLSFWCYKVILMNYSTGATTMALKVPLWITYLVVPVCLVVISLVRAVDLFVVGEAK